MFGGTKKIMNKIEDRARRYIKHTPEDWLKVTIHGLTFYATEGKLDPEVQDLGPVIADLLEQEYGFDIVTYYKASNTIIVLSRIKD